MLLCAVIARKQKNFNRVHLALFAKLKFCGEKRPVNSHIYIIYYNDYYLEVPLKVFLNTVLTQCVLIHRFLMEMQASCNQISG